MLGMRLSANNLSVRVGCGQGLCLTFPQTDHFGSLTITINHLPDMAMLQLCIWLSRHTGFGCP